MQHNCYIGEWLNLEGAELITYDELKEKIKSHNENYEYGVNEYGEDFMNGFMKKLTLKDYLDKRKNVNFNRFDYCPYCGEKINWKEFRKE